MDVSKGEFARLINVSPGRVSQYIAAKQIFGDAIVGEGRGAKINYELACEQLRLRRDPDQAIANGLRTNLETPPPANVPASPSEPVTSSLDRQLLEQKVI